jgi:hypothetical protein
MDEGKIRIENVIGLILPFGICQNFETSKARVELNLIHCSSVFFSHEYLFLFILQVNLTIYVRIIECVEEILLME